MNIAWNAETMSTGIEGIDREHQELIRAINELITGMEQERSAEPLGELMDFLTVYVMNHFSHEEGVMEKYACPSLAHNLKAHDRFRMKFSEIVDQFDSEGPSLELAKKIRKDILEWLIVHIQGCDAQLKQCTTCCNR